MDKDTFYCKGRELANYLIKSGATLLRIEDDPKSKGLSIYIFKNNDILNSSVKQWETIKKKCLF